MACWALAPWGSFAEDRAFSEMSTMRRLFGPSREEIWRQLASELEAQYVEGGFWKRDRIDVTQGDWIVSLDTYYDAALKRDFTRMRAAYSIHDSFQFTIYRRGIFSDLGKALGMQDVEVGDPAFDDGFIIKGNDEAKLRGLFQCPRIRELISLHPSIHLTVRDSKELPFAGFGAASHELSFKVPGVIKDIGRLKQLFDLFAEILERLVLLSR